MAPPRSSGAALSAARKAGVSAAARLFRAVPRGPRALSNIGKPPEDGHLLLNGPILDVAVPSCLVKPSCLFCGAPVSFEKVVRENCRLPLGRSGFYGACSTCDVKAQQSVLSKEWKH